MPNENLSSDDAIDRIVSIVRDLDDGDDIAKTLDFVCGGRATAIDGNNIEFDQEGNKRYLAGSEQDEFDAPEEMAKGGFWIRVGKASIYIRKTDDGVSTAIYPLGKEDGESIGETYAFDAELSSDDDQQ
jgi:hypothetical protein